jgi:hypothetical protein
MTYKNLSLTQLKTNYSERAGFVFVSPVPSSRNSCEKLYKQIKDAGLCAYEPDFINELDGGIFYAFVYPAGVSFHSGDLYAYAQESSIMTGQYKVDALAQFLKDN